MLSHSFLTAEDPQTFLGWNASVQYSLSATAGAWHGIIGCNDAFQALYDTMGCWDTMASVTAGFKSS